MIVKIINTQENTSRLQYTTKPENYTTFDLILIASFYNDYEWIITLSFRIDSTKLFVVVRMFSPCRLS